MSEIEVPTEATVVLDLKTMNSVWYAGTADNGIPAFTRIDLLTAVNHMSAREKLHALASLTIAAQYLQGEVDS